MIEEVMTLNIKQNLTKCVCFIEARAYVAGSDAKAHRVRGEAFWKRRCNSFTSGSQSAALRGFPTFSIQRLVKSARNIMSETAKICLECN